MEYNLSLLAESYALFLSEKEEFVTQNPSPTFNVDSYNEYEYISCINSLNSVFDTIDDLDVTIKFLKGE